MTEDHSLLSDKREKIKMAHEERLKAEKLKMEEESEKIEEIAKTEFEEESKEIAKEEPLKPKKEIISDAANIDRSDFDLFVLRK